MLPALPEKILTNNGSTASNLAIRKGNRTGYVYVIGTVDPVDSTEHMAVEDGQTVMWNLNGQVVYPQHRGWNWGIKLPFRDITKVTTTEWGFKLGNLHWDIEADTLVIAGTELGRRPENHTWTPDGDFIPGEPWRAEELKLYWPKEVEDGTF